MLILSRKTEEKVVIAGNIEITVVEIRGDTVKLGINAPKDVKIYRSELVDAIREAAQASPSDLEKLSKKLKGEGK
ncbi:MAG TPA: carbon storage regulator CsrA [bacterium]|jgi:carbon storage regulator